MSRKVSIAELTAGAELDRLIAERVLGWGLVGEFYFEPGARSERIGEHAPLGQFSHQSSSAICRRWGLPSFSTDISAAWMVVEKLQADGIRADILSDWHGNRLVRLARRDEVLFEGGWGPSAPLQICRAAIYVTRPT